MESVLIYVTTASFDEARRIGSKVVEERLAACANILGGMTAIFPWNGSIQEEQETVLLLKTIEGQAERLMHRVRDLHDAEIPCIIKLPITGGNPDFLRWIGEETRTLS